ncbi:MAG TPA: large-conductance mechanosensitive channel protein MscL [Pirellulales bacterium]
MEPNLLPDFKKPLGVVNEFLSFIKRGNVIDLAVGVIIGGAFGKIVSSMVNDILMPPIGYLIGGVNFSELAYELPGLNKPVTINYGNFLQVSLDFLIIAFSVFVLVKVVNAMHRTEEKKPPEPSAQEKLLIEIRDLLKMRQ